MSDKTQRQREETYAFGYPRSTSEQSCSGWGRKRDNLKGNNNIECTGKTEAKNIQQ